MDQIFLNSIKGEIWVDPRKYLQKLQQLDQLLAGTAVDEKVRQLETNLLKRHRESREAAIFTVGLQALFNDPSFRFTYREDSDYDVIIGHEKPKGFFVSPVQLKRLVPENLNPTATLDAILQDLRRLPDSANLVVAIFLCRDLEIDLSSLVIPQGVKVREIYVFGSVSPDKRRWMICGDLMKNNRTVQFFESPIFS